MLDAQFKAMLDAAKAAAQPTLDALPLDVGRAVYRSMRLDGDVKFGGASATCRSTVRRDPSAPGSIRPRTRRP